jgi:uncharacterized protein (TIGR00288 family)
MNLGRFLGKTDADEANGRGRVGLFVDGPNVLREEFDVDLDDLRSTVERVGRVTVKRLYLDENAPSGLIKAAEARGFEVVVTSGDVDVKLAVEATERALSGRVDVLAIASRDVDFKPVFEFAAANDVRTLAIAPGEHGRSSGLTNAANDAVVLSSKPRSSRN